MPLALPKHLRRALLIGLPVVALALIAWWTTRPEPVKVRLANVAEGAVETTVAGHKPLLAIVQMGHSAQSQQHG